MTGTRLANIEDALAIARICNEGISDRLATFETDPRTSDDIARGLRERADRWPTVVVERDARGTQAGRAAMDALVSECEGRGIWKLPSRVFPENEPSRKLLAKVGFREVGTYRRHAKLDGAWRDTVIVERLIGEAAR